MNAKNNQKQQLSNPLQGLSIANQLIARYNQIFDKNGSVPSWAVHKVNDSSKLVHCSIPFVGKHYPEQSVKLLVYASAENLTGYSGYLDDDSLAVNRHRAYFEKANDSCDAFFPNVHIQPMNNGCLAVAALYLTLCGTSDILIAEVTSFDQLLDIMRERGVQDDSGEYERLASDYQKYFAAA